MLFYTDSGAKDIEQIESTLNEALQSSGLSVAHLKESVLEGVHEATLTNGLFLYTFNEGKYFVRGDLFQIEDNTLVNLTEQNVRMPSRLQAIQSISESDMIIFPPKDEVKAVITVFTDVDCGYCRQLHRDVPELNDRGVKVRYLAFPRSGPNSEGAKKMESAWCTQNRRDAITRLKRGKSLPAKRCNSPIAHQYETGVQMGVRGTPTIIFENGEMLQSYLPIEQLLEWLDL